MSTMASQITGVSIVCWTVCSGADQRKHQSSASLAFVWGIHRQLVNSLHKRPLMQKMSPFDGVIMSFETFSSFPCQSPPPVSWRSIIPRQLIQPYMRTPIDYVLQPNYIHLWWSRNYTQKNNNFTISTPGVGITKPNSFTPLFSEFFTIVETHISYWISRLYLTCVTEAQLWWQMSTINVIQRI